MIRLLFKYIFFLSLMLSTSGFLDAQKQKVVSKIITKDSFKSSNKIPFEVTRYKVNGTLKVKEIKGWSPENYDCGKPSIYLGFLGCADEGTTAMIMGSGFGNLQGNGFVNCSEPKIKVSINSWNDNEININVQTIDKYLEARKVTITITNDNLEQLSIAFDVIGVLKVKNANSTESYYSFGQCMWAVAKHRDMNELPIPESPTVKTDAINENYEPKLYDCILFDNNTMGVLIKVSPKMTEDADGHEQYTWSVILEEMNTKCNEKRSVVICKFQVGNVATDGEPYKFGILLNINSNAGGNLKAVAYYRYKPS